MSSKTASKTDSTAKGKNPKLVVQQRIFQHWVEIGRVVLISYGPDLGKLAVIIDVIDQNRAYIAGPLTGVKRQAINFKRITLTKIKIPIAKSVRSTKIIKEWKKANVEEQWAKTNFARRIALRKARANMNDFDRFKAKEAKKQRNQAIQNEYTKLLKEAKQAQKQADKTPAKK
eukprot:TRINITY_DN192_c0_g1_i3.p1 TRINITY_DN192_c0_g1~~TRINITY_DN192_c0_g1_i3.p1  ORF type:complete len:173 (-),score=35.87 TRINITY_DN192_c0_g1_i3:33-551(-)